MKAVLVGLALISASAEPKQTAPPPQPPPPVYSWEKKPPSQSPAWSAPANTSVPKGPPISDPWEEE